MKRQIRRLSAHQNGKVFGILSAVASLFFFVPMFVIMLFAAPTVNQHGSPVAFSPFPFILFPVLYLVFGYAMTAVGCILYNLLFRYIGGIEYEARDESG